MLSLRSNSLRRLAAAAALGASAAGVQAMLVYPNNPAGDAFTNAGGSNQGQAIGGSGWFYNNVRTGGTVGVSSANPQSGNGSVAMSGGVNAKADLEYLAGGACLTNCGATSSMGLLANLTSMSYDWYRDSSSTATGHLHPAMRVLVDADGDLTTLGDRGGLVFERIYNSLTTTADVWTTDTVTSSTYVWNFGLGVGSEFNINGTAYAFDATLAEWQAYFPNAVILGFSVGIGSGWNAFSGAVDNIGWSIGDQSVSYNFELDRDVAQVSEPATLLTAALALLMLGAARRRT
jgi:hypothetical protein